MLIKKQKKKQKPKKTQFKWNYSNGYWIEPERVYPHNSFKVLFPSQLPKEKSTLPIKQWMTNYSPKNVIPLTMLGGRYRYHRWASLRKNS